MTKTKNEFLEDFLEISLVGSLKRWNDFKKVFNVCFRFRSVVGQSKMFLRSKIDHGGEEISDLV